MKRNSVSFQHFKISFVKLFLYQHRNNLIKLQVYNCLFWRGFFLSTSHSFDSFQLFPLELNTHPSFFSFFLCKSRYWSRVLPQPKNAPVPHTQRLCTWVSVHGNCGASVLFLASNKRLITVAISVHSWVFLERAVAPHHIYLIRLIGSQCWTNLMERCAWLSVLISNCFFVC